MRFFALIMRTPICFSVLAIFSLLAGCDGEQHLPAQMSANAAEARPMTAADAVAIQKQKAAAMAGLGRKLFFDPRLSASGKVACATCHDPGAAYAPANNLAMQPGGADLKATGTRVAPSLRYLQFNPAFTEHFYENATTDAGPTGGLTWDGRVNSFAEQAKIPLFAANEMANHSAADLAQRLQAAGYGDEMRQRFGPAVFANADHAVDAAAQALMAFEANDPSFNPYNSKFDAYLAGKARLSGQELHGLKLFNDPAKGNCAQCHTSTVGAGNMPPQFTDRGFVALGVPRNPDIAANKNAGYYDLGLCGPARTDLSSHKEYCGMFMTPSLRNVATRKVYFHNGRFTNLEDVLHFYVERDIKPEKWYPRAASGKVALYDDLPASYRANVDKKDAPFGGKPGDRPKLSESEIKDVIAFLGTLNDGYKP